mgnify:CR=1 FL=1
MKEELISVIVPIYNVELYLSKCLDSVINQTYKNLEIILIDDGSVDNCPIICDKYAKKDKRIKVIHKDNKGVSSARNYGLEIATGNYVIFIDSDDYIEPTMLEILYINMKKTNSDISICNYNNVENNISKKGSLIEINNSKLSKEEFYNYLFYNTYYCGYLWNKLFKKKVIDKIRFDEEIHILEDLVFIAMVADNCNNFYYDYNNHLYNYRIRNNSALRSKFNLKQVSSIKAREIILEYAIKYNCQSTNVIKFSLLWDSIYYKYKLKDINNLNYQINYKLHHKYLIDSLKCKEVKLTKRIRLVIAFFFPNFYFGIKELFFRKEDKDEKRINKCNSTNI